MGYWSGKHILLVSPEPWEGLQVSKHHYARALAEAGGHVIWMGPPESVRRSFLERAGEGIDLFHYRHWLRGVNRLPDRLRDAHYDRLFQRVQRLSGTKLDVFWCFDVSRFRRFPRSGAFRLLHLVDLDILYEGDALMRDADLILTTTAPIRERALKTGTHAPVHELGHALDPMWSKPDDPAPPRSSPQRVAYAGQLCTPYLDTDALRTIAEAWPGLAFDLYGPFDPHTNDPAMQALLAAPNVVFHGLRPGSELVGALRRADILLVCYRTGSLTEQLANPHKMLEYLSTGNVVVASDTLAYRDRPELVMMTPPDGRFADTFAKAIREFPRLNSAERREARVAYARSRTVPLMLDRIATLIEGTGGSHDRPSDHA